MRTGGIRPSVPIETPAWRERAAMAVARDPAGIESVAIWAMAGGAMTPVLASVEANAIAFHFRRQPHDLLHIPNKS